MDPTAQVFIAAIVCGSVLLMVKLIADASAKEKRPPSLENADAIERRLASIEHAVEAMAIEVERNGELQRFNARLAEGADPREPVRIGRPTTPH